MHTRLQSVILLVIVALVLSSGVPVSAEDRARQDEPVVLYDNSVGEPWLITFLDPQVAPISLLAENTFLGLTNVNPATDSIAPELAASWTVSEDGRVWTFTLRDDVPWVRWDPAAGEASIVRMVTAHDVAYGIARACDPRTGAAYRPLIDRLIVGCNTLAVRPVNEVSDEDYALVHARAVDDTTLEIRLQIAAAYFLTLSWNSILYAVPREIIEEYGEDWTLPGTIVTNGPFMLDEWRDGWGWRLVRNPYLPDEVSGPGNVEQVVMTIWDNYEDSFQAYLGNAIDLFGDAPAERVATDTTLSAQAIYRYRPASMYYAFANDIPPFDNVHVRRAFSAALDRAQLCRDFYGEYSTCMPMIHFTPPGVWGAPPIDEVGVGFDPDYAREQLALGGYADCEGFPEIRALTWEDTGFLFTYLAHQYEKVLGCDPPLIRVEDVPSAELFDRIDPASPEEFRPHMWVGGWYADYPDANNFLGDFMHCSAFNAFKRPCSEIDDLIDQAAAKLDLVDRIALYRDIEERLFGPEGAFPLIPTNTGLYLLLAKPWVEAPTQENLVRHYDWYTIDQAAQLAARGG